jgi:hypothetical protein
MNQRQRTPFKYALEALTKSMSWLASMPDTSHAFVIMESREVADRFMQVTTRHVPDVALSDGTTSVACRVLTVDCPAVNLSPGERDRAVMLFGPPILINDDPEFPTFQKNILMPGECAAFLHHAYDHVFALNDYPEEIELRECSTDTPDVRKWLHDFEHGDEGQRREMTVNAFDSARDAFLVVHSFLHTAPIGLLEDMIAYVLEAPSFELRESGLDGALMGFAQVGGYAGRSDLVAAFERAVARARKSLYGGLS